MINCVLDELWASELWKLEKDFHTLGGFPIEIET